MNMSKFGARKEPGPNHQDIIALTDLYEELLKAHNLFAVDYRLDQPSQLTPDILSNLRGSSNDDQGWDLMFRTMALNKLAIWWFDFYEQQHKLLHKITPVTYKGKNHYYTMVKKKGRTDLYKSFHSDHINAVIWCLNTMRTEVEKKNER